MVTGTLFLAGLLLAQGPAAGDLVPISQRSFTIPIRIDPSRRGEIKELQLYASSDQGKTWSQVSVATPDKDSFTYYAPTDGVYWFSVCVVDQRGGREPTDINKAPPGQKVLIDTLKPNVRITSAERQGDDVLVAWEIQEDHPDLGTFKLEYQAADAPSWMWTVAPCTPGLTGQTRIRATGPGLLRVRAQLTDQVGNQGLGQAEVKGTTGSGPVTPVSASGPAAQVPAAPALPNSPAPGGPPLLNTGGTPPAPVVPSLPSDMGKPPVPTLPPSSPAESAGDKSPGVRPASLTPEQRSFPPVAAAVPPPLSSPDPSGGRQVASTSQPKSFSPSTPNPGGNRSARGISLTGSTHISLEYEVSRMGPSGLAKVELYVTPDDGRTWQLLANGPDLASPITADLPGEGVYGLTLVLTNGAGHGRKPPQTGDLPQMKIEVDTTKPDAILYKPEVAAGQQNALLLAWKATDKNLADKPISLFWSERADGKWEPIAQDLPNSGSYVWQLPPKMPGEVYLRLLVRDSAGNVSTADTPRPELIDLVEPEGQLKGLVNRQP
jgi:hypothetical protein